MPLGRLKTPAGRAIVFPNSHVHKVTKMMNTSIGTSATKQFRRIVVFFLVNPEKEIYSTRHVPVPQQGLMSRQQALEHRLQLMHERKHHKQDWNVREIELCEH